MAILFANDVNNITHDSFVDENGSIFIGRCEIAPSKMFPFLNENNECEDFFHIIGEEGQVMRKQKYIKDLK